MSVWSRSSILPKTREALGTWSGDWQALVVKPEFDSPNCLHSALVDYTNQSGLGQMGLERWLDIPSAASGNLMPCERPGLNLFFF